jgi:hypothetical protein
MSKINIRDCDIIYISYDEPNCDENWADLNSKLPHAKRVHGVKGSDAAHKAAAAISNTDRFITIDGDNIVDGSIIDQVVALDDSIDISRTVFSWPSLNTINGLLYGNGGVKCWPKDLVLNMRTHEHADPENIRAQVDFCWDINYVALDTSFSMTVNNKTPLQAWRAGFREGVKMSLDQGVKVTDFDTLFRGNINRLLVWMMVGADVENGMWAILGARQGCYMTHCTDWDYVQVRDFEYLNEMWGNTISKFTLHEVNNEIDRLGVLLQEFLPVRDSLTVEQSIFFKRFNVNTDRQLPIVKLSSPDEYDIVMITYGEENAEENWEALSNRFPRAIRIDGVKGIHNAHKAAAEACVTDMFWVVDGDATVFNNFDFDYIVPKAKQDFVHVWRAKNPVNGLVYGYGGIKLLPRKQTASMDTSTADMTTSISKKYKPVMELASVTNFATDEFNTWRSAFRECCKLSSQIIDRQVASETLERLTVWTTYCGTHQFNQACLDGANAGKQYGEENAGNVEALTLINDFTWLQEQYNAR